LATGFCHPHVMVPGRSNMGRCRAARTSSVPRSGFGASPRRQAAAQGVEAAACELELSAPVTHRAASGPVGLGTCRGALSPSCHVASALGSSATRASGWPDLLRRPCFSGKTGPAGRAWAAGQARRLQRAKLSPGPCRAVRLYTTSLTLVPCLRIRSSRNLCPCWEHMLYSVQTINRSGTGFNDRSGN